MYGNCIFCIYKKLLFVLTKISLHRNCQKHRLQASNWFLATYPSLHPWTWLYDALKAVSGHIPLGRSSGITSVGRNPGV